MSDKRTYVTEDGQHFRAPRLFHRSHDFCSWIAQGIEVGGVCPSVWQKMSQTEFAKVRSFLPAAYKS